MVKGYIESLIVFDSAKIIKKKQITTGYSRPTRPGDIVFDSAKIIKKKQITTVCQSMSFIRILCLTVQK